MEHVNERDCPYRNGDCGVKYFMRGPKLDWGVILLKPGQNMGEHGHTHTEETFYFLSGAPSIVVDCREIQTEQGDVFRLDPPARHDIRNHTSDTVRIVFIKTPYLPDDKT